MPERPARPAPPWDPVVTVGLLFAGLVDVTQSVAQARSLDAVLARFFTQQGIGDYSSTAVAQGAGIAIAVVNTVCLVLAIAFAVPRLRAHRRAFWVPLVCAAINIAVSFALFAAAVLGDPAFGAFLRSRS